MINIQKIKQSSSEQSGATKEAHYKDGKWIKTIAVFPALPASNISYKSKNIKEKHDFSRLLVLKDFIYQDLTSEMHPVVLVLEALCYCGAASSAVIVWRLATMSNLSWINKMFLSYFSIDCIFGILETYFLFKLHTER